MGDVYRARDVRLGREVALKVLPRHLATRPELVGRFSQEARAASALNHPNIIAIHDIGEDDGMPYLAMELVLGRTLRAILRDGPMALPRVVHLGGQAADGLAAAHERGIIHRDVKPENLMVTPEWLVKILDFGLAKLLDPGLATAEVEPADGDSTTRPGGILGTPGYMAPEQARGRPADARSDLFALGCVLYEMSFGVRAFQGHTPLDTLTMILRDEPPLAADGQEIPPELGRVLRRCLDKDPSRRYQSARTLAADLRTVGLAPSAELPARGG